MIAVAVFLVRWQEPPPPEPAPPPAPTFDVVRVGPGGDAVLAGRAGPGALVRIMDGAAVLGEVEADHRGEWVFLPNAALAPGLRNLSLRARHRDGTETAMRDPVVLYVPHGDEGGPVLAVRFGPEGDDVLAGPAPAAGAPPISIDSASQLAGDAVYLAGRGPAGTRLQLYADNTYLGSALADLGGRWRIAARVPMSPGRHVLRADNLTAAGTVENRIEVLLDVPDFGAAKSIRIDRTGDHWRITQQDGAGLRSTVVFRPGPDQIRDPSVAYPGQMPPAE